LLKRVCREWPNIFSMRAENHWGGEQDFGDWHVCLSPHARTRAGAFHSVLDVLRNHRVETILCVPYLVDEIHVSIALHECFGARLCLYLMDDQNVEAHRIPDDLMREFLQRCSLRLATHPELRQAYEQKFGLPFHLLPAVVPDSLVLAEPSSVARTGRSKGALIGSFWDQTWFDRLCSVLSRCGRKIDWYGNNKSPWVHFAAKQLTKAGITAHGVIPEDRLACELRKYSFVIVPVGVLDEKEANTGVARLSLPGRILFAAATSNTPLLVVGSPQTCGARFVAHFGLGEVVRYEAPSVTAAMNRMSEPGVEETFRKAAARIAPGLSDRGVSAWLQESIRLGEPADGRFEDLFSEYASCVSGPSKAAHSIG
ncbi:MAG TPA: beta-1,6-galactofuranosyltransferase, partial [Blastocatellia bacterium]|nr:beta-1,6-galactofuranosyltransferase [Blastocatellia bacterium]